MIKAIVKIIAGSLLVIGVTLGISFMTLQDAGAQSPAASACLGSGGVWKANPTTANPQAGTCTTPGSTRTVTGSISQVGNILIFVVGAVSVLMIIVGGIRYALAQGDSGAVNSAKNTILYAIIGVVLSLAAFGIVNFVVTQFK